MEGTSPSILYELVLCKNYKTTATAKSEADKDCPICFSEMKGEYTITLPCGHEYCRECILTNIAAHKRFACPETNCKEKELYKHYG